MFYVNIELAVCGSSPREGWVEVDDEIYAYPLYCIRDGEIVSSVSEAVKGQALFCIELDV